MAFYDNKLWLLSHIHNSFISSDETGVCEMVMGCDNFKKDLKIVAQNQGLKHFVSCISDDEDEVDGFQPRSPDIKPVVDETRRRNTKIQTEMTARDKLGDKRPRVVQWRDGREVGRNGEEVEKDGDVVKNGVDEKDGVEEEAGNVGEEELFPKKPPLTCSDTTGAMSLLAKQLEQLPQLENNPWRDFAKIDAGPRTGREVVVYCSMADRCVVRVWCVRDARVSDVVGLVCLRYTERETQPVLRPGAENYCLYMCEEDGSVDWDFPALDNTEMFSKYGFQQLALVEAEGGQDNVTCLTLHLPDGTFSQIEVEKRDITVGEIMEKALDRRRDQFRSDRVQLSYHMEAREEPGVSLDPTVLLNKAGGTEFYIVRDNSKRVSGPRVKKPEDLSFLDAPLFQAFNIAIFTKVKTKVDVQVGISCEKIEIDPLQQATSARFWSKQKAVSYDMDNVVSCEVVERRARGDVFKMVYLTEGGWRTHEFEGDRVTVDRIVEKVNHLMDMRQSEARKIRKEYLENKEKKKRSRTLTK